LIIEKLNIEIKDSDLKHKNYLSKILISKTESLEKSNYEIKQAKTLSEIINTAKKHNLNPQKIEIETKKPEKQIPKFSTQQISINTAKAILNSHSHISQNVAALNIRINEEKKDKDIDKKSPISLQELLKKDSLKEENTNSVLQNISKKVLDSDIEEENSLTKMLDKLNQNSSKSNNKENLFTTLTSSSKEKHNTTHNIVNNSQTKMEYNEIVNNNIDKSNEQLNQKIINAKQTVQNFAKTLQEQVENYKPPFTRMQLSLDPKDLGKVEVTLVSRGNNLHIQVNSNPTAIGVMAIQGNELKNQLTSMGFTDVQMQFNMNQQQQQQQQQQNSRRQIYSGDKYIDIDEIPENYESLEIIIPQYV